MEELDSKILKVINQNYSDGFKNKKEALKMVSEIMLVWWYEVFDSNALWRKRYSKVLVINAVINISQWSGLKCEVD